MEESIIDEAACYIAKCVNETQTTLMMDVIVKAGLAKEWEDHLRGNIKDMNWQQLVDSFAEKHPDKLVKGSNVQQYEKVVFLSR